MDMTQAAHTALVDQLTEPVAPLHGPGRTRVRSGALIGLLEPDRRACPSRHLLADSLVRPMTGVVAGVSSKDMFEVALMKIRR
jgi:hypothetical protein